MGNTTAADTAATAALRKMEGKNPDAAAAKWLRQFQTLTHPSQLGSSFHVLALGKDLPPAFHFTGLQHARERDVTGLLGT